MAARPLKDLPINSNFVINCNWECAIPARTIRDTVLISYQENGKHQEEDFDEIIDPDRSADFDQPAQCKDKPSVTFAVPEGENFYISQFYVICDCKIIELFGEHGGYIDTYHGVTHDECDDFRVCEFKADLSSNVNKKITVNFLKLLDKQQNHLWIFGIQLTLKPMSQQNLNSSICIDNVADLLKDTKVSDKASKCFKFIQESMNNRERMSATQVPNFSMLGSPNLSPHADKLTAELKQYIDHKFLVLNEFLILRERTLHDKIDLILDHIKKSHNGKN